MKGRESSMPDSRQWEEFFDPAGVIELLGCASLPGDVAEFGCGYGTFTLPVASKVRGAVHAFDIDPEMVDCVTRAAAEFSLGNIVATRRDFMDDGSGLPDASMVQAMVFNILHIDNSMKILREAYRVLAPGGKISIIHWRTDIETPRGPSLDIRPTPGQCLGMAARAGFQHRRTVPLGKAAPWHYGLVLDKPRHEH
jgi:SAM-dependent methyltransferase